MTAKRYQVEGISRRTEKGYALASFHSLERAEDMVAHCNRPLRSGRARPIFWYLVDLGE